MKSKKDQKRDIMQQGDCVILLDQDRKRFQHITIGSKMKKRLNRRSNKVDLSTHTAFQDRPYGSVFELRGNDIIEVPSSQWTSLLNETNVDFKHTETRNNSSLFHSNKNQQMTQDEIIAMKADKSNLSESGLISKIAESSKTFHLKTEFSKEKYLKSKKAKHLSKVLTLKSNASNLCEMYFIRKPTQTMGLRIDTMSQILHFANIHHDQHVMVVESCTGLMIAAIAERMGGSGRLFHIFAEKSPVVEIVNKMAHLTNDQQRVLINVNIGIFNDERWSVDSESNHKALNEIIDSNTKMSKFKKERPTMFEIKQWIKFDKVDSLIICCKYHPLTMMKLLFEYLDFGCPFVIWSEYLQPLIEVKEWIHDGCDNDSAEGIGMKLFENWFRELQVLPQRTHPMVNLPNPGGFILCGTKVRRRPSKMTQLGYSDGSNGTCTPDAKKRRVL